MSPLPSEAARRRRRAWIGHGLWLALAGAALVRAATAAPPTDAPPASSKILPSLFAEIDREEPEMRAAAAHAFPGDAWSQDDDFHEREQKKARSLAAAKGVRLADVLRAIDEGIRDSWFPAKSVHPNPTVPPCRPRLSY